MFELGNYVACICEGGAEEAIINILLDSHLLIFEREQLIDEKVIRTRDAASFERKYLRMGFEGKITVFRILDSRRENFRLISCKYRHQHRRFIYRYEAGGVRSAGFLRFMPYVCTFLLGNVTRYGGAMCLDGTLRPIS